MLLCAEHTGQYSYSLRCACGDMKVDLWLCKSCLSGKQPKRRSAPCLYLIS
ncbi:MAG: hypothetical protein LBL94_07245 [Prevotellaceae bacterium]|nr:hypothetical protein [Prevotellaceae bacterium]